MSRLVLALRPLALTASALLPACACHRPCDAPCAPASAVTAEAVPASTAARTAPPPPQAPAARVTTPGATDADVEEALVAAGAHRAELEGVLARFREQADARRLAAARFLIANMPGRGYVITRLHDEKGATIPFDPLAYPNFAATQAALDAIEKEHGPVDFDRERIVLDVETIPAAFLVAHVERSVAVLEATPAARRPEFGAFLEYVLPYRGSEEPVEDWLSPLRARFEKATPPPTAEPDAAAVWRFASAEAAHALGFDERYYVHPTDQGFAEMERSKLGRCEDITNRTTYAARALGLVTAADYTPAWGHRDNNHAWPVLLDAAGRGSDPAQAHAAKIYRKTFSLQRDALAFRLPADRVPPNRFLASKCYVDVTDQYAPTSDVAVELEGDVARAERFAYLCVFNGGEWVAIQHAEVAGGRAVFAKMGRNLAYLPAIHDGKKLVPAAPPRIVAKDGSIEVLAGGGAAVSLAATAVSPEQKSPDTKAVTPVSFLAAGKGYDLFAWKNGAWSRVGGTDAAGKEALVVEGLASDALYWLVERGSRKLERIFSIRDGRQKFW